MDGAFNVLQTLWSDGDSSFLDSSGPSVFRSVSPNWRHCFGKREKRESAAASAWRHLNSNLIVCRVCNWIKSTEEEGWLLKLLLREVVWDLMRGCLLRCDRQTGYSTGEGKKGTLRAVRCSRHRCSPLHMTVAVVNPSSVIPAMTETLWQSLYAVVGADLWAGFWQNILITLSLTESANMKNVNCALIVLQTQCFIYNFQSFKSTFTPQILHNGRTDCQTNDGQNCHWLIISSALFLHG